MTLQELQKAVYQLSSQEQTVLLETLVDAMNQNKQQDIDRRALVQRLRGCLKQSGQPQLSDRDVDKLREERLVAKYLQ